MNEYLLSTIFLSQCSITRAYKPNQKRLLRVQTILDALTVSSWWTFSFREYSPLDTGTIFWFTTSFTRKRCTTKVAISTSFTNRSTSWGWSWRRIRTSRGWSRRRIRPLVGAGVGGGPPTSMQLPVLGFPCQSHCGW